MYELAVRAVRSLAKVIFWFAQSPSMILTGVIFIRADVRSVLWIRSALFKMSPRTACGVCMRRILSRSRTSLYSPFSAVRIVSTAGSEMAAAP